MELKHLTKAEFDKLTLEDRMTYLNMVMDDLRQKFDATRTERAERAEARLLRSLEIKH
jgi:hypothetical protein